MMKELIWSGRCYDHSGYAVANRNLLLRAANSVKIQLAPAGIDLGPPEADPYVLRRLRVHLTEQVSHKAPLLRFHTPVREREISGIGNRRRKICYTMMETEGGVSESFSRPLNEEYDEVWTPTQWGKDQMRSSVKTPIYVVPLGIDPHVYSPRSTLTRRPKAKMLSPEMGRFEVPYGFAFLTLGYPSFRKGFDIVVRAFDLAFRERNDVCLVIATMYQTSLNDALRDVRLEDAKARIYHLVTTDYLSSLEEIYRAYDAYVSISRGEGWNLPLIEAAACGLPVIASGIGAHVEIIPHGGAMFLPPEGYGEYPEASHWTPFYEGQKFALFGERSIDRLAQMMIEIFEHRNRSHILQMADILSNYVRSRATWDVSLSVLMGRL